MRQGVLSDISIRKNCPVYQPIPMKDIGMLRAEHTQPVHSLTGIKKALHRIPTRPGSIHAMTTSLERVQEKITAPMKVFNAPVQNIEMDNVNQINQINRYTSSRRNITDLTPQSVLDQDFNLLSDFVRDRRDNE